MAGSHSWWHSTITCCQSLLEAWESRNKLLGDGRSFPSQMWVRSRKLLLLGQAWEACILSRAPLVGALLNKVMTGGSKLRRTGRNKLPKRLACSTWLQVNFGGPTWRTNTWARNTRQGDACLEQAGEDMSTERHLHPPALTLTAPGGRTGLPLVAGGAPYSVAMDLGPAGIAGGPVRVARILMGSVLWLG